MPILPLFNRLHGAELCGAGVEGEGTVKAVVAELLQHLRRPAGHTGDGEDRRKQIGRDA